MKCVDLATALFKTELNEDCSISIPSLCAYFRYNIGDLNNLLGASFKLNSTDLEIIDENGNEISSEAAMIYKYLYLVSFYSRQVRNFLGVGGISQTLQIQSDGGMIKMVDKTQAAKVYIQMRKDTENTLKNLVNKYKFRNDGGNPQQVVGDDVYVSPKTYNINDNDGILYQNNNVGI